MNGSWQWDTYLASPADFAGVDDMITNLAKEKESLVTLNTLPKSLIITSFIGIDFIFNHIQYVWIHTGYKFNS